jgi:hypothetical protein
MAPLAQGDIAGDVGLTALIQRLGPGNQPTGAGINVGQVEAQESPGNAYPNPALPEFGGKIFTPMSGAFGFSGHANAVGQNMYGSASIAPGVPRIYTYEAGHWVGGHLLTGTGSLPLAPPSGLRVFNNAWIADSGASIEILRRADLVVDRDDVLIVNGLNNGGPNLPLMGFMFNGLSVGRSDGGHSSGPTSSGDGLGRQKPEIVAPHTATSWASGIVSAAVALMYQTALTPPLSSNANARRSEVIKAALMAGANHGFNGAHAWSNNPATSGANRGVTATPLDPHYGADTVNVDRSHRILTGLERNGSATLPTTNNANSAGWDFASISGTGTLHYRFSIAVPADRVSILAAWHRVVDTSLQYTMANFNLELRRIGAGGVSQSLVGNAGLGHFGGGNVVSQSTFDNVEHLYITNLAAGTYDIELKRVDALGGSREVAIAWLMPSRFGDVNGDGIVNADDLIAVILAWGLCPAPPSPCPADVTGNGVVNVDDLIAVILNWG